MTNCHYPKAPRVPVVRLFVYVHTYMFACMPGIHKFNWQTALFMFSTDRLFNSSRFSEQTITSKKIRQKIASYLCVSMVKVQCLIKTIGIYSVG